jgi:tetratricopeptide repeat protein
MATIGRSCQLTVCLAITLAGWPSASFSQSVVKPDDAEALYRDRANLDSAKRAAALWSARATSDFDSAWKLARISYWIGKHGPNAERRPALEHGIAAGETAVRLMPDRPEGHFWLAADMGALAESSGIRDGLKYRGRIKSELERVIAIDPDWQEDSADAALGQWYFEVPRIFGGSRAKAEERLQYVLRRFPQSKTALSFLADVVAADGRLDEARALLGRVLAAPVDPDWAPEDRDSQKAAADKLKEPGGDARLGLEPRHNQD